MNSATIWLFNIAMENGSFIDDVPSYKPPFMGDFPWLWGIDPLSDPPFPFHGHFHWAL